MVMQRAGGRRAFTLVELLVVIGIIVLLIAILMPVLHLAREQAMNVVCQSNMHQWGLGIQMYVDAAKGELPQKGPDGSNTGTNFFGPAGGVKGYDDNSIWFNAIPPYVNNKSYYQMLYQGDFPHAGSKSIFICPMQGPPGTYDSREVVFEDYYLLNGIDSSGKIRTLSGMANQRQFPWAGTYVFNSKLTDTINPATNEPRHFKMSRIKKPAETVLMTEKITYGGEYQDPVVQSYIGGSSGRATASAAAASYNGVITSQGYVNNVGQTKADWRRFTTRHRHGGNLLFADGHVGWFAWLDAQFPTSSVGSGYDPIRSDANQPGLIIWSAIGPVN